MLEYIIAVIIGGLIGYYIMNVAIKYNKYKKQVKAYEDFIIEAATEINNMNLRIQESLKK